MGGNKAKRGKIRLVRKRNLGYALWENISEG